MAKGKFTPKNLGKYVGNVDKIIWRSSWELRFCQFCDNNPHILRWSSEELFIPYIKPTDGRMHKYYPDFFIEFRDAKGVLRREIIEIKPHKEAVRKRKMSTYDRITLAINEAKWEAAVQFCEARKLQFRVITEKSLFRT